MSSLSMIKLVMGREIRQRIRSKGFAITTALLCVAIIGVGVLNRVLSGDDSPTKYDIAVAGGLPAGFEDAAQQTAAVLDIVIRFETEGDRADVEQRVRDGDLDVAVDADSGELISKSDPSDELSAVMNAAWQSSQSLQAAVDAGLDDEQISAVLSPAALTTVDLDADKDDDDSKSRVQ